MKMRINFDLVVQRIIDKGENDWKENKPIILITGDIVNDGEDVEFLPIIFITFVVLPNSLYLMRYINGKY